MTFKFLCFSRCTFKIESFFGFEIFSEIKAIKHERFTAGIRIPNSQKAKHLKIGLLSGQDYNHMTMLTIKIPDQYLDKCFFYMSSP